MTKRLFFIAFFASVLSAQLQFADRYSSTLASGCTSPCTSLSVASSTNLPVSTTLYYVIVRSVLGNGSPDGANTEEVFKVTARTSTTLTVVGAQANTSASNHGASAQIIGTIMTAGAFTQYKADVVAASGFVQLGQVVTAGSATTVTFSSISGSFTNLVIVYTCRTQAAVSTDGLSMEVNSDTTAGDYTATQYTLSFAASLSSGTVATSSSGSWVNNNPGSSATASYPASGVIRIPVYAGTTFFKKFVHNGDYAQSGNGNVTIQSSGTWKSTAAITSLIFSLGGTDTFVNGSTFTLYGEL